jgi:hypothetical protein
MALIKHSIVAGVVVLWLDAPPFEAKQWADEPRLDCSFEDRSGRRKLGLALPPQPR